LILNIAFGKVAIRNENGRTSPFTFDFCKVVLLQTLFKMLSGISWLAMMTSNGTPVAHLKTTKFHPEVSGPCKIQVAYEH